MKLPARSNRKLQLLIFALLFSIVGLVVYFARAATPSATLEAENSTLAGGATIVSDVVASGGKAIKFSGGTSAQPIGVGGTWNLKFSDEFNGTSVDATKWNIEDNSNFGAGNNEDECYMSRNATVAGGELKLTAKRETVTCGDVNPDTGNKTYYFTSGMLHTRASASSNQAKFKFKQGYVEARMKAPKGNPYWPALWLVGPGDGTTPGWPDYGEFDITELYGARPDITTGTFHYKCTKTGNHCQTSPDLFNIKANSSYGGRSNLGTQITTQSALDAYSGGTTDYNVYGFLWESNKITWYINGHRFRYFDGTNVYSVDPVSGAETLDNSVSTLGTPSIDFATVFAYDHSINLNLAFGGDGPRYSDYGYTGNETSTGYNNGNLAAVIPDALTVDYVRVWQH